MVSLANGQSILYSMTCGAIPAPLLRKLGKTNSKNLQWLYYSVVNRLAHFQCWNLMMLQQKTAQKLCKNAPYCWRVGIMLIILFGINFLIDGSFGWKISSLRMLLWLTWLRKKVDNNLWNFVEHGGDDLGIIMRFFFFKS